MKESCTQLRRKLVTYSTLDFITGDRAIRSTEWVTEPCGIPLFSDVERERGTCRSCADGWTHEHNYPVERA